MDRQPSLVLRPVQRPPIRVFTWGRADFGQLGVMLYSSALPSVDEGGDTAMVEPQPSDAALTPLMVEPLSGRDITHVAAGALNTAFLTADGEVYSCGVADSGQLGVKLVRRASDAASTEPPAGLPVRRMDTLEVHKVVHVAYGQDHGLAVTDKGVALAWGAGDFGQLGLGPDTAQQEFPKLVRGSKALRLARAAAGSCFSAALTSSGQVYTWGQGSWGALGHGDEDNQDTPKLVKRLWHQGVVQVSCGEHHAAALTANGRVLTWGKGKYGALGQGEFRASQPQPQAVRALRGIPISQVVCGGDHTLALTASGAVFAWGRNTWGQLGLGTTDNTCSPQLVLGALEGQRAVQITAGARHSAALTAANTVLVWGCGESGQLGSGRAIVAQLTPALLPAGALPVDAPVAFIAAGGDHMAAVVWWDTASGDQQPPSAAPVGPEACPGTPSLAGKVHGAGVMPLRLPDLLALAQAAATEQGPAAAATAANSPRPLVTPLNGHASVTGAPASTPGPAMAALIAAVEDVFSSPGYLAAVFSEASETVGPGGGPQTPTREARRAERTAIAAAMEKCGQAPYTLDIDAVSTVYAALLRLYRPEVVSALAGACSSLLDMLLDLLTQQNSGGTTPRTGGSAAAGGGGRGPGTALALADQPAPSLAAEVLPALLVLVQNPLNAQVVVSASALWARLCAVWYLLDASSQQTLAFWVASLPPEVFGGRVLRPLQAHISRAAERGPAKPSVRLEILAAAQVVSQLHAAHTALVDASCSWGCTALLGSGPPGLGTPTPALSPIPATEWSNGALSEAANLREEYLAYISVQDKMSNLRQALSDAMPLVSICQVPILLTPEAKSRILQGEASVQKQHMIQNSAVSALLQGINPGSVLFLDVHVRRDHVLQDALTQILARPEDLKKPLRVTFIGPGGVPEEGLDEGGVSREFFQILVSELFRPEYGMYIHNEETRAADINPASLESELEFQLVGAVLGLAVYNNIILDVHLPMVTYKKLLGQKPGWRDLCEAQPALARGLAALLAFDGDVEATFCRAFEVEYEYFGETRRHELLPGGASISVTAENRLKYAQLYTQWVLETSIQKQFDAFKKGFMQVCGGPALSLLSPSELELLVAGLPHLDFSALKDGARYEGGFNASTPVVTWLWDELLGMTLDQKKRFLSFTTGCDRAPVGGLGKLTLTVQRSGPDTDRLPTAHTCFNVLLLPEYVSQAKLRDRLLTAIDNAQGFGLQ